MLAVEGGGNKPDRINQESDRDKTEAQENISNQRNYFSTGEAIWGSPWIDLF
jgi:hypothetical protein